MARTSEKTNANKSPKRNVIHIEADEFKDVYANSFNLETSLYDFKLLFGIIKRADDKEVEIEQQVAVRMSPQHTKSVLRVLADNVKNYEDKFGKIVIPQHVEVDSS